MRKPLKSPVRFFADFDGDNFVGSSDIENAVKLLTQNELGMDEIESIWEKVRSGGVEGGLGGTGMGRKGNGKTGRDQGKGGTGNPRLDLCHAREGGNVEKTPILEVTVPPPLLSPPRRTTFL